MSISKLRGKSALGRSTTTTSHSTTLANNNNNNNLSNNNNNSNNKLTKSSYIPQTSLLKIEPFVPSLNARLRRPIHRSYSTLSSSYFKKLTNQQNHHRLNGPNVDALKARGKEVTSFQRQRSKSSGSTSSSVANPLATSTVVTQQPNGVCRIVRSPKEQEKLPDRINYDRRGLGAIPIFENEPNLRLLSLQHNLINVFHIPQQGGATDKQTHQSDDEAAKQLEKDATTNNISKAKLLNSTRNSINKRSPSPMVTVGPPNSLQTRFSPSLGNEGSKSSRLIIKNSIILNTSSNTINTMKKSKSFISNYSKHLSSLKKNLHSKCSMVRVMDSSIRQSPGSLDVSPCESPVDVLNVKNNQLLTSYGEIFQNLVFLDLYDNQIEKISNLDGLTNLTVLLLGKNRISDMTGLASLKNTLRVLDLHGNRIISIGNKINCLQELKSLNLAGNQIRQINQNDFMGLMNLRELNLKRNKIKRVNGFNHLTSLERLWLCHNDLHKVEDMSSIAKAINLLEVTIENNPVSLAGDCVSFLVSYLPKLQMLSQMPITEQVRRAAMAWRRNKELSDSNYSTLSSDVFSSIRREEVISNARTNWELLRSQQTLHKNSSSAAASVVVVNSIPEVVPPSSQETVSSSPIVAEIQQEAVKLPPIQGQNQNQNPFGSNAPSEKTHSSASSLGPNVDSSSSYFSSDNEDRDMSTRPKEKRHRDKAREDSKGIHPTENKETNENGSEPAGHEEAVVEETIDSAMMLGVDSTPTNVATTVIQNPSVTIVSQSTATTINNGSSAMNLEKSSSSSLPTGTAVSATVAGVAPSKSQHQQQHRNPTMSLAINGNNNPGITSNPNVTTKRYMHGSLMRSQTTKPASSVVAGSAIATATSAVAGAAANRASAQLSHHNSTANNGVATSGSGNGLGNGGTGGGSSSNNNSTAAGGVTSSSSCNNGASNTAAANKTSTTISASSATASTTATIGTTTTKQVVEREREQGGDYLIEICGRYLNVYGTGALRFIDKQWSAQKAGDVHTLNFSYINFNSITAVLGRVKARFPHAEHFVFRETNISCLGQLNAMAELQGITSLTIDSEGNPICGKDWRLYAVYRLSHWGLKTINGQEVSEDEMNAAQQVYVGLSDLVLWSMPDGMLQPLLGRLRLEENCSSSKLTPKEWLLKADNALKVVVGKEALQWKKTASGDFENTTTRERGRMHFSLMIENTCNAVEKLNLLEELWPSLLLDIVRNTLLDYSQLDVYLKNLMSEIMK
ncbi:DEP domain-containing protein DDB_G0279099 [Episyrphus balteatus]|uniref:DEP domain-containing protein DDB_G0279099 n=1 Tax=Episyrphus balteatus TaxID=286459 RepID=UPI002484ED3B|nr:DEP domain-containing protein DDB_G0279099 [Episyrphus balteatus]